MNTKMSIAPILLLMIFLSVLTAACQPSSEFARTEKPDEGVSGSESKPDDVAVQEQTFTDPEDVKMMLEELKRVRHERWTANTGWWHSEKTIQHQSGNLHGTAGEWWFRFSNSPSCPQIMQIIIQEDGQILETSILSSESDWPAQETLPDSSQGEVQTTVVKVSEQSCPDILDSAFNHIEALLDHSDSETFESVEAQTRDGFLFITISQKDGFLLQVSTVAIDLKTGFLVEEKFQFSTGAEQKSEGVIEYLYSYETYDQLPSEVEETFNSAFSQVQ